MTTEGSLRMERSSPYTQNIRTARGTRHTKLMMVGINTDEIDFGDKKPSNLVFLIDTSGSMYEDNKLPLVQQSFAMLAGGSCDVRTTR